MAALIEAGIIHGGDSVRRVIIDAEVGNVVVVHVERYGDERLLSLARGFDGVAINRVEAVDGTWAKGVLPEEVVTPT